MERLSRLSLLGPGLVMAAAGVGAGDIIASSLAGAKFGTVLLWAVIFGAILKYVLNEGLIRWQTATGQTMIHAWNHQFGNWVSHAFLGYLIIWSVFVGGGLLTSMGMVTRAIFKNLTVSQAGVICALAVLGLVFTKSYKTFERIMKVFVVIMFVGFVYGAIKLLPDTDLLSGFFIPSIPSGSMLYILGLMGGIGGSLTIMCYGYWAREKGLDQPDNFGTARVDLGIGYVMTGVFDLAVLIIAAVASSGMVIKGSSGILLHFQKPVLFVMTFSVLGGAFMVFLSVVLIYFNNKKRVGRFKNGIIINIILCLNLLIFVVLFAQKIQKFLL